MEESYFEKLNNRWDSEEISAILLKPEDKLL
jgi:hypothetical protein